MTPASRVLLLALCSRAALLLGLLASDAAFPDLDSSSRLAAALPCAGASGAAAPPPPAARPVPLLVWDTAYFSRIAKCGYETDKINAFFPLLPAVMRAAAGIAGALPGLRTLPPEAAHVAAGLALNVGAFAAAALCLHRLSVRTLGSGRLADLAALFFCLNPASVFYSAAYSEALFAAGTWAGTLLLPTHHWAGVAALTLAGAARSNGILAVWFPLHALLAAWRQRGSAWPPLRGAALSCCAILAPYVAMQAQAYAAHCLGDGTGEGDTPTWCRARLPSVYAFIQKAYWDVGFLRFYRDPTRLPMVLMSVPVAWLSMDGCCAYFSADWQRAFTLGLYPRPQKLPRWLAAPAAAAQRATAALRGALWPRPAGRRSSSSSSLRGPASASGKRKAQLQLTVVQRSNAAAPYMYHWALMTAVALLAMHVNVATRFLSACPPLYWRAAELLDRRGLAARALWLWCFTYIVLGFLLFANFYPWT